MQPKFTRKTWRSFFTITPILFAMFCLFSGKTNAQCTWTASTVYPIPVLDQAAVSLGANLYSFAGVSANLPIANSYTFNGASWIPIAPTPQALEFPAAATDGTNIYIVGGASSTGASLS